LIANGSGAMVYSREAPGGGMSSITSMAESRLPKKGLLLAESRLVYLVSLFAQS